MLKRNFVILNYLKSQISMKFRINSPIQNWGGCSIHYNMPQQQIEVESYMRFPQLPVGMTH